MELIIGILVLAGIAYVGYTWFNKEKADGSHPLDAATQAPYKVETPVAPVLTQALDVNKDGKVDLEDAKEAVKKAKSGAKKAAGAAKETVKKATSRGRKPKA
jgi:hypothetical protein